MEDGPHVIPTVGTLETFKDWTLCISEWVVVDLINLFERSEKRTVIARSPTFQMVGANWNLEISYSMCAPDEDGFFVSLCRHQSEFSSHSISCHVVVKGEQGIIGGFAKIQCDKENQEIIGFIGESSLFLSLIPNGCVTVLCTFYEIEGQWYEEISKNVFGCGKHPRKNLDGIDILSSHMKNLFFNHENYDFVIKVKNREFQVHKAILSVRSPVLAAMLQHDMAEKKSNATEIVDCEPEIFEKFLLYLYSGQVEELSWENATSLYALGDKYDLEHLRKECVEFMESNFCIDAFCDATTLAVRHNLQTLVKTAEDFFQKNVTEILVTPKWQTFVKEHPVACNELFIKYANNSKLK